MRIVLDTNVLLISLPKLSPYRPIFDAFLSGKIKLLVSTEILNEYVEILEKKTSVAVAKNVLNLILSNENTILQEVYYRWHLIEKDPDDNKFIDCAVAGSAKYIVTDDKHFNVMLREKLFEVSLMSSDDFLLILEEEN
jgi:putative PIN family toxin of toxin-antitoxin system